MTFDETKTEFMKRFKTIKEIYRNESKKGICTTVLLTCGAKGVIKLADGEADDFEKSILWAYAKATKNTIMAYSSYRMTNPCREVSIAQRLTGHRLGYPVPSPMSLSIASMYR